MPARRAAPATTALAPWKEGVRPQGVRHRSLSERQRLGAGGFRRVTPGESWRMQGRSISGWS